MKSVIVTFIRIGPYAFYLNNLQIKLKTPAPHPESLESHHVFLSRNSKLFNQKVITT